MRRVGILTSGGDAPGMNAAIRAATAFLLSQRVEVIGIQHGYKGLLAGRMAPLTAGDVDQIQREGGTVLGSARCAEFVTIEGRNKAREILGAAGIEGLLVIGGNGSLTGAHKLIDPREAPGFGLRVIGVPASIDNDVGLTGMSIGVDTAMNTIVEACDKIADTASAHDRTFIVEVMGRDCGYLAMTAAVAAGADAVLFPESSKDEAAIVETVAKAVAKARSRSDRPKRVLVIKAEGTKVSTERLKEMVEARFRDSFGEKLDTLEVRLTVLGHVVRGGRPSAFDRILGSRLAYVAVRALLAGENDKMAAWLTPFPMPPASASRSAADPYCWLVDLAAVLAETEAMHNGTSDLVRWRSDLFASVEDVLPT
ncbi:MAG: 6-phosphofructokinase [Myxococcales bacterium]|nr:6-phosphofructokinase [Myxococcales bacterium]